LGQDDAYLALEKAWEHTLASLATKVQKPSYESWIKPVVPLSFDDGVVILGTPSRFAKHWLEGKYLDDIKALLEEHLGQSVRVVLKQKTEGQVPLTDEPLPPAKKKSSQPVEDPIALPLNNKYNFDSFVVGPCNRLAHATAMAISELPGKTYNPFFVYGRAGLGKTHLLHAIGLAALECNPNLHIAYVRGETFTFHYVTALREHKIGEFRKKYRNIDLWLVDDIQFLVGKDRTEEEFFHTYNALYDMGKQVVLTSDRSPKDLELDGRLLSRFECGMVADMVAPDFETRMAILSAKAERENILLPYEVMAYIAGIIKTNVRQLEGALIKLHAYGALMKTDVTEALAKEVLGSYFGDAKEALPLDTRLVQFAVARKFNVSVEDIIGTKRSREIVLPRQVAMYLSRELTDSSLPCIGKAFGGKDHTTVLHSIDKIKRLLDEDGGFSVVVSEIASELRNGSHS
jgi:chromosomal replication initiator protein